MSAAKVMCGSAVVALLASQLVALSPERRAALSAGFGLIIGRSTPATAPVATQALPSAPSASIGAAASRSSGFGTIEIPPDRAGQYQAQAEIEGQRIPVLIDTGASHVVLTYEDADRLGIRPMPSDFKYMSSTANGQVANAKVELPEMRLGPVAVTHVTAFVAPRGALFRTLVGMNFLSRLRSFRVDDGRLVLQP